MEAEGITPFVANSPLMSFFYHHPKAHKNKEGEFNAEHGVPYLSGVGRLFIKDAITMAGGLVTAADNVKTILVNKKQI